MAKLKWIEWIEKLDNGTFEKIYSSNSQLQIERHLPKGRFYLCNKNHIIGKFKKLSNAKKTAQLIHNG